jgi:REP element-mobilizing transposase RayT
MPGLRRASEQLLKGPPILLQTRQAHVALAQFLETARFRDWSILAVSIMVNHFHIVVSVPGDPSPGKILGDFKSWATRALTAHFGEPPSKTWWTERGSKRKLSTEAAISEAIQYVLYRQPSPLVTWSPETGLQEGIPPSFVSSTSGLRLDAR